MSDFGDLFIPGLSVPKGDADLYLGDCKDRLATIPDKSVDLIVTDPPYLLTNLDGGCGLGERQFLKDIMPMADGLGAEILDEFMRVLKVPNMYIWGNWKAIVDYLYYFKDRDVNTTCMEWHKTNPTPLTNNVYLPDTEFCLFVRGHGVGLNGPYKDKRTYWVSKVNTDDKDRYGHPTIKPLNIIRTLVRNSSEGGGCRAGPVYGVWNNGGSVYD